MQGSVSTEPSFDGFVLVSSCFGTLTGGGLVSFNGQKIEIIDTMSSTGLAVADGRLMRLLNCRDDFQAPGELLIYDSSGVERYYRIDALSDPHDILWDGQNYVIVSTGTNSILWIAPTGELVRKSAMPGEPDSWHLNSIALHNGRLFVCAFGRFSKYRQWGLLADEMSGIVFDHDSGQDVLSSLDRPHHPRATGDNVWIVCNSGQRELLEINATTGKTLRKASLVNWTRGLAFSREYIFVGESATRRSSSVPSGASGTIAVLDRTTWRVVERIQLPFEEVYDLVPVPLDLLEGIRRGFKTNPQRVLEQNQNALFAEIGIKPSRLWAISELLPLESCAVHLEVTVEPRLKPNEIVECPCLIENRGSCIMVGAWPYPVVVTYKWIAGSTDDYETETPFVTILPEAILPRNSARCNLKIRTPMEEGFYELRVSLFQEGRGFFGDLDIANAFTCDILISQDVETTATGADVEPRQKQTGGDMCLTHDK